MMSQEASGQEDHRGAGRWPRGGAERSTAGRAMQRAVPRAWRLAQEKRLPIMIIFCYAEISEVGQPRPGAGLATPPFAGMTGPSPIRCRAFCAFRVS